MSPPQSYPFAQSSETVLVIEDDPSISLGLTMNLKSEGYTVLSALDGIVGLQMVREYKPNLVILDVMLPQLNGFEVISVLRQEEYRMPIIVLSARTGEMDKVTGLELGAEDYVAKPFSLAELLARVRAALRRCRQIDSFTCYTVGSIEIDFRARLVRRGGGLVEMTTTEFDVLSCLVQARGEALSREMIFRRVRGPNHHGTPRTIDNFVQQLRAKLEDEPQSPRYLQTVRGVGYRFAT
ncbi:response regulator transcription factor [Pajaroellobacter abortibovis]|uniref:Two-component system response regulator n=1 Tax=Pajaroellobacter abortibovis TaxID=1882918 RepID=A0A1L6MY68_9BACT|nr:response regulator transcription factor [Pajaroellobacter abortibovis]APS00513.1 two-component system response regulator [Pajaroellobacter abortibovis]